MSASDGSSTSKIISCGQRHPTLVAGSIDNLPERFDALVSSDDNYLSHSGGISLRLWEAGRIEQVVDGVERPQLRLGDVFVSRAGDLVALAATKLRPLGSVTPAQLIGSFQASESISKLGRTRRLSYCGSV
jgi:hypothetical protein